jgi:outer membrane protein assembly factor BamB
MECRNEPKPQVTSQFRTAFYAYYPEYGNYLSLDYTCDNGCNLCFDASYEGNKFTDLALHEPLPPGTTLPRKEAARWAIRRGAAQPKAVWQDNAQRRFTSFVISPDRVIAAGHPDNARDAAFLAAINIKDGSDAWLEKLPANAVKGGTAIGHDGKLYVALENGQLLCFSPVDR